MGVVVYGASGYAGGLIAAALEAAGAKPILAGRDDGRLDKVARPLGLPHRAVAATDGEAIQALLSPGDVLVNCAGPFALTAGPLARACIARHAHYVDLATEPQVIEALAGLDAAARRAGIGLLPAAGIDAVPGDCLVASLKTRIPKAHRLALAFQGFDLLSRGSAAAGLDEVGRGVLVRRRGELAEIPSGSLARRIDFGNGAVDCLAVSRGDLAVIGRASGLPNIDVYLPTDGGLKAMAKVTSGVGALFGDRAVKGLLSALVRSMPDGPSEAQRAGRQVLFWAELSDDQGFQVIGRLRCPEGYTFTQRSVAAIVERALAGRLPAGFQTASKAFGADFVLDIEGVSREDLFGQRPRA